MKTENVTILEEEMLGVLFIRVQKEENCHV
jgi:hypothetical protein